jgi:multiple sugar transport system substrate-binding protein
MGTATGGIILAACAPATAPADAPAQTDAGAAPETTTVVLMYNANEISEDEMAAFEDKYGYNIEFVETDMTTLFASLAAGTPIDCFRVQGIEIPSFVLRNIPLDLTERFATSEVVPVDDLVPANDFYLVEGKRYGMVKDWSPDYSIWANESVWEEMGVPLPDPTQSIHYTEWRDLSPQLTKKEGDRTLIFGTDFTPLNHPLTWIPSTFEVPSTIFNEDFTELQLEEEQIREFIDFWLGWMQEGGLPSVLNPHVADWSGQDWRQRAAATTQWGYWFSGMAESEDVPGDNILMMRAPSWGPTYTNPCASGTGMAISSATKVPDAAWKLFEWFCGEEPAQARARSGWGVPGLKSQFELMPVDQPWRQHNFDMVQWEMENTAVAFVEWTPYASPSAFESTWNKYLEPTLTGSMSIDEMLQNVANEFNQALQEGLDRAS